MQSQNHIPPLDLQGRDEWHTHPQRPDNIMTSGSMWFCTICGELGYANYEHDIDKMIAFVRKHDECKKLMKNHE